MVAPVEAKFGHELKGLRILIEQTRDGVLAFSLYSDVSTRDAASDWLKHQSSVPAEILRLSTEGIDLAQIIGNFPSTSRHCLLLFDIETAFPNVLGYVNLNRERLLQFGHALVFWIREEGMRLIAESAPDFWAWRSHVFDFRTAQDLLLGPTGLHDAVIGHYNKEQLLEQVHSLAESGGSDFVTQFAVGRRKLALGRYEEADIALEQAVVEAERQGDKRGLAEVLELLGRSKIDQGFFEEAKQLYSRSLEIAKQTGSKEMIAAVVLQLSALLPMIEASDPVADLAATMNELAEAVGDQAALARAHEQMGNILFLKKDLRGAEQEYLTAMKYEEQLNHRVDLAQTLLKIRRVYEEMGAEPKENAAIERAIASLQEFGWDQTEIADIMQRNGVQYPRDSA